MAVGYYVIFDNPQDPPKDLKAVKQRLKNNVRFRIKGTNHPTLRIGIPASRDELLACDAAQDLYQLIIVAQDTKHHIILNEDKRTHTGTRLLLEQRINNFRESISEYTATKEALEQHLKFANNIADAQYREVKP
jgi:hypothetical protein